MIAAGSSSSGFYQFGGVGGGSGLWSVLAPPPTKTALAFTAVAGLALLAAIYYTTASGRLKSPWSHRRRKNPLSHQQWRSLFTPDGRLHDGGIKLLKKVRSGGVDPIIRPEVWPFLLGVYDLNSSKEEREVVSAKKRKEYEELRKQCSKLHKQINKSLKSKEIDETYQTGDSGDLIQEKDVSTSEDIANARESPSEERDSQDLIQEKDMSTSGDVVNAEESHFEEGDSGDLIQEKDMSTSRDVVNAEESNFEEGDSGDLIQEKDMFSSEDVVNTGERPSKERASGDLVEEKHISTSKDVANSRESPEKRNPEAEYSDELSSALLDEGDSGSRGDLNADVSVLTSESSDSDSSEDPEVIQGSPSSEGGEKNDSDLQKKGNDSPSNREVQSKQLSTEDFTTWQRIIRLDAVRTNAEWISYSPSQAAVSDAKAQHLAGAMGLKDYDHLEPCRIFNAARLTAILKAYAVYDPEIGYCQGMSDLLSPIISVMEEDHEAFWCFVGFMKKARHNFRLDEVGIRRQLNIVSKIIKFKDSHLYRHLEMLQAEDCFFVYRMVVVLFRRELTFEQTLCLWEVMWADQTAIRAGIGKCSWSKIRLRAPPTEDLLLFAIAASVLQKRKLIIEKYSSMDEILRECNSMSGHLDIWKLLDDAHNLVVSLHDKIET